MAGTEEQVARPTQRQRRQRTRSPVENPATGEVIAHVPDLRRRRGRRDGRARRAPRSPAGRRSGFEGRGRILRARRSGCSTTPSASSRRSSRRPARPTRTRSSPRSPTAPPRSASGPRTPRSTSADEKVKSSAVLVKGKKLMVALPAARRWSASSARGTTR